MVNSVKNKKQKIALTPRQNKILSFIKDFISAHSYPPSMRELAAHFKMSTPGIQYQLNRLQSFGYLKRNPFAYRSLQVTR